MLFRDMNHHTKSQATHPILFILKFLHLEEDCRTFYLIVKPYVVEVKSLYLEGQKYRCSVHVNKLHIMIRGRTPIF